jgi:hypothetical protein
MREALHLLCPLTIHYLCTNVLIFYMQNAKIFGKLKVGVWSCGEEISVWITLIQVVKIG